MKTWKILLGIYQVFIASVSLLPFFLLAYSYATSPKNVVYHWPYIVPLFLFLALTITFCLCNAIKMLMPGRNIFSKWKGLTQTSIIFTILWTLHLGYLLICQTSRVFCKSPTSATAALQQGQTAPDFSVKDQSGNTVSLSGSRGKIILLDFWGVWCGPCRKKLPHTQEIYDKFKDKGLVVIGIHSAFGTEKAADFITENNYTFPTGIDPGHIAKDYGVNGWPTYFLIDKQGHLCWGPKHSPPPEELIESLLEN